jgi:Caspase domain
MVSFVRIIAGFLALLAVAEPAFAQKRVALVIGNGAYKAQRLLDNPPNDALLIGESLTKAKFDIVETKINLGIAEFRQALRRFQAQANGAEVALVYFAGHGIEANGANWMIPTDAELTEDRDLDYEAIKGDLVLQALQGARMRVLVLDACRDNPFGRNWRTGVRSSTGGLAKLEADDVLVLYAAAPGRTASDGTGSNSPFAAALAKRLPEPGLAIQLLGGSVRDDVLAATGGNQRPYVSASITGRPFYLVPGLGEKKMDNAGEAVPRAKDLNDEEKKFFDSCVKLSPHLSRDAIVARLAKHFGAGSHSYGWRYDPPAPNLNQGDFPIASAEALPNGVLLINYHYRWGRLFLMPVTLAIGGTRGFTPRDTSVDGASIQLHGMWIQESGHGCATFYMNGETGEAAGNWIVTDDAGKPLKSSNRIKKAVRP